MILYTIMMYRVYALYNCHRRIIWALLAVLLLQFTVSIACGYIMIRDTTFSSICVPVKVPHQLTYYGLTNAFSQSILVVLTVWRHILSLRHGARLPIVTLMVRDGAITFASIFILVALLVASALMDYSFIYGFYYWMLTIIAIAGCRLTTNMHRMAMSKGCEVASMDELSTFIHSIVIVGPDLELPIATGVKSLKATQLDEKGSTMSERRRHLDLWD